MGEVYEAFCRGDRRRYAVKVLAQEHAEDPTSVERFQHEFWALRQMEAPGLVKAHALFCDGDVHFYSMELLEGVDLAVLARERRLSAIEVTEIGLELCDTLRLLHDRGVIHRDVKPGNVIRLRAGGVKLVDLGIGKLLPAFYASSESRTPPEKRLRTSPGIKLGTPGYIAPEAGLGEPPTRRHDVFSLGVTLFRLATGRMPFRPGVPVAFGDEPRPASSMGVELPPVLEMVLQRAMITNPSHRIPSMREFFDELDDARAELMAMETSKELVADEPSSVCRAPSSSAVAVRSAGAAARGDLGTDPKVPFIIAAAVAVGIIIGVPVARGLDAVLGAEGWISAVSYAGGLRLHVEEQGLAAPGSEIELDEESSSLGRSSPRPGGQVEALDGALGGPELRAEEQREEASGVTPRAEDSAPATVEIQSRRPPRARRASARRSSSAVAQRWVREHDAAVQRCIGALAAEGSVEVVLEVNTSGRVTGVTGAPGTPSLVRRCLLDVFSGLELGAADEARQVRVSLLRKASKG